MYYFYVHVSVDYVACKWRCAPFVMLILKKLFCAVMCTTDVHNDTHTHEQFLKMTVGSGLVFVRLFGFNIFYVILFSLNYFVLVLFAFTVLGLVSKRLAVKNVSETINSALTSSET